MAQVQIKAGKGKLRGRHCVVVTADGPAPGFRGKGATPRRFAGCFKSLQKAQSRARTLGR